MIILNNLILIAMNNFITHHTGNNNMSTFISQYYTKLY